MSAIEDDKAIIRRVLGGDTAAYRELIEKNQSLVFGVVGRRIPAEDVTEVAHQVFVRAYRSLGSFGGKSAFVNWLSKIAVRECYDYWRASYRRREQPLSRLSAEQRAWVEKTSAAESSAEFASDTGQKQAQELLQIALGQLSAENRAVITLVHLEEKSIEEAAELLDWTRVNVKVRAFRARKQLRAILENLAREENEK